nr:putative ribonuclease H-like domain-containing protein [Tanacetum cinerariifolium]
LEKAKDKGIVDSGCSRSMSGNKDKLEDFEDFHGGEHFNLISVSQICDQSHRVLFTENECLVLSKYFSLPDPSIVILSIPRKHNLYTLSLNELAPKGPLTCLIAKASQNESTLWHRRLGHVNFRNMNKLVNGNLVRARIEAIRLFLAFASFIGFKVYQMDVKSAFLYENIVEEVYVTQPRGFEDPDHPKKVYKVVKALYGLHQAPRAWYERLFIFLLKHRYKRGSIDQTLFIKKDSNDIMLVQVYVDDIIFGSTRKDWCEDFKTLMQSEFKMSSMGPFTFFLGLQVDQRPDGIFIHQEKYVADILKKFNFDNSKLASTPFEPQKIREKNVPD